MAYARNKEGKARPRSGPNYAARQKIFDAKVNHKGKKIAPSKLKRTAPRPGQWKCKCGRWTVDEVELCACGRNHDGKFPEEVKNDKQEGNVSPTSGTVPAQ